MLTSPRIFNKIIDVTLKGVVIAFNFAGFREVDDDRGGCDDGMMATKKISPAMDSVIFSWVFYRTPKALKKSEVYVKKSSFNCNFFDKKNNTTTTMII